MQGKRLYVGNLNYATTQEQLQDLFGSHGEVVEVKVVEGKGFAFIEMGTSEEAQVAMDTLNQSEFHGRNLRIDEARPFKPRRNDGGYSPRNNRY